MITSKGKLDKRVKWFQFSYNNNYYKIEDKDWFNLIEEFYTEITCRFALGETIKSYDYVNCWSEAFWIITTATNMADVHTHSAPAFLLGFENELELISFKSYYFAHKRKGNIDEILKDLEANAAN